MNIVHDSTNFIVAKTSRSHDAGDQHKIVRYGYVEDFHNVYLDEILCAEIHACEELLKHVNDGSDRAVIEAEILKLKDIARVV